MNKKSEKNKSVNRLDEVGEILAKGYSRLSKQEKEKTPRKRKKAAMPKKPKRS